MTDIREQEIKTLLRHNGDKVMDRLLSQLEHRFKIKFNTHECFYDDEDFYLFMLYYNIEIDNLDIDALGVIRTMSQNFDVKNIKYKEGKLRFLCCAADGPHVQTIGQILNVATESWGALKQKLELAGINDYTIQFRVDQGI